MTQKILVVGGTGFTGRRVLETLRGHPAHITVFCRDVSRVPAGFDVAVGDLNDEDSLTAALEGKDGLICIASLGFGHAPKLVSACRRAGVKRALFISTTGLFTQLNAASKVVRKEAERLIITSDLDWTILRPTMIYGRKGDRNMERLVRYVRRFPVLFVPGDPRSHMQPVFVDDVATAAVDAFFSTQTVRKAYNISGKLPLSFSKVVSLTAKALDTRVLVVPIPLWPCRILLRMYGLFVKNPRLKEEQLLRLNENKAFDHGDAARDFGYNPRIFEDGIKHLVKELHEE